MLTDITGNIKKDNITFIYWLIFNLLCKNSPTAKTKTADKNSNLQQTEKPAATDAKYKYFILSILKNLTKDNDNNQNPIIPYNLAYEYGKI